MPSATTAIRALLPSIVPSAGMRNARPVRRRNTAISGVLVNNSPRRPKVSIVQMAGRAKMKEENEHLKGLIKTIYKLITPTME